MINKRIREAIVDEKKGSKNYKSISKSKEFTKREKRTIIGISKDETKHKYKLNKISKRLSSR